MRNSRAERPGVGIAGGLVETVEDLTMVHPSLQRGLNQQNMSPWVGRALHCGIVDVVAAAETQNPTPWT